MSTAAIRRTSLFARHLSLSSTMMSAAPAKPFAAAVIGAGPAGVAVVGRLLDLGVGPIAWIDPAFAGGRLQQYPEVPSNTRVRLFIEFAKASDALHAAAHAPTPPGVPAPLAALEAMDASVGCDLVHAQRLCRDLAAALERTVPKDRLTLFRGWAGDVTRAANEDAYTFPVHGGVKDDFARVPDVSAAPASTTLSAARVFLCTGAEPLPPPATSPVPASVNVIDLDTCLTPSRLRAVLAATPDAKVAVVGGSHSAILCVKNLVDAGIPVVQFHRHPLKYAVDMPDGWILYDNTGLKGMAAKWAKANLEDLDAARRVGVDRIQLPADEADEPAVYAKYLTGVTHVCYAVGYRPRPVPAIAGVREIAHDVATGDLVNKVTGAALPGVRGYGIAFPERTTDPHGNVESSVGMWKFMKYLLRVIV
ncbi:hypothetical protein H9P43_008518 [Blastocladiella emersonii ATCC 22665]|nr:hypothetical protein H9P43_008518 [Blastocladiella emersonii ATCC 22665]